jgi:hypothetical protein
MGGRSRGVWRDPGAADTDFGRSDAAQNITRPAKVQIVDTNGDQLRPRRHEPVEGAPRPKVPSWYSLVADQWAS